MTNPLLQVSWETCLLEPVQDRAIARRLKRETGEAPEWSRYFWSSPWFAKAAIRLGFANGLLLALDFDLAILIALVVSQENSCRFCYATTRVMMRVLGLKEARVQAIESQISTNGLDPRTAAAVRFARAVNRGHPLDGRAEREQLVVAGFNPDEIRELAYVATSMGFMNRMTTIAALSPTTWERASELWFVRLIVPLLSPLTKRIFKRGRPVASTVTESPLSGTLHACYDGSPIQPVLAETMRDLWSSSGLPQRTKLLMFATIAQGIDCAVCASEIERLAAAENIDAETVNRAAAHLNDPALSTTEREICEFARESLWYQPQLIQRRAQALCANIGPGAFVEALAVVALGNMLMRLIGAMEDPA